MRETCEIKEGTRTLCATPTWTVSRAELRGAAHRPGLPADRGRREHARRAHLREPHRPDRPSGPRGSHGLPRRARRPVQGGDRGVRGASHEVIEDRHVLSPEIAVDRIHLPGDERARRARTRLRGGAPVPGEGHRRQPAGREMRASLRHGAGVPGTQGEAVREARLAADLVPVSTDALDGRIYQEWLARVDANVGEPDAACDILETLLAALP